MNKNIENLKAQRIEFGYDGFYGIHGSVQQRKTEVATSDPELIEKVKELIIDYNRNKILELSVELNKL